MAEIEEITARAQERGNAFRRRLGLGPLSEVYGESILEDGEVIVAFGVIVGRDGVRWELVGRACDASVEEVHRSARAWYQQTRRLLLGGWPVEGYDENLNLSGVNLSGIGDGWVRLWTRTEMRYTNPFGRVQSFIEVNQMPNDRCTEYDYFAVLQYFRMEPGERIWGSDWYNCEGKARHIWRRCDGIATILVDYAPRGDYTGRHRFSLVLPPGLIWQYEQPGVTTIDESSLHWMHMTRAMYFGWRCSRVGYMTPGSKAQARQYRGIIRRRLVYVTGWAQFRRPAFTPRSVSFFVRVSVRPEEV